MKNFLRWLALPIGVAGVWYLVWLINSFVIADVCFAGNTKAGLIHWIVEFIASAIGTLAAVNVSQKIAPKWKEQVLMVVCVFFVLFSIVNIVLGISNGIADIVSTIFGCAGTMLSAIYCAVNSKKKE